MDAARRRARSGVGGAFLDLSAPDLAGDFFVLVGKVYSW
jgi:hypothetical protein